MTDQFKPYFDAKDPNDFNVWECQTESALDTSVAIDDQEALANELEKIRQEAREQGYNEGLLQAKEVIESQKVELGYWLNLLQKPIQIIDDELTQEMIQTIIWLCQHCIGIELSTNPEKIKRVIDEIKMELPALRGPKQLTLSPLDFEWLKNHLNENEFSDYNVSLVEDPSYKRGDFCLKGEHSELDGRLHSRLVTVCSKYLEEDNLIEPIEPQD